MNDLYRSIFIKSRKEQKAAKKFDMFGNDISGKSWTFTILQKFLLQKNSILGENMEIYKSGFGRHNVVNCKEFRKAFHHSMVDLLF